MGVKNNNLKQLAKQLLDSFSDWDIIWETNKELIDKRVDNLSKKVRNQLAGLITREMKRREGNMQYEGKPSIFIIVCKECGHKQIWNSKARGINIRLVDYEVENSGIIEKEFECFCRDCGNISVIVEQEERVWE